MSNFKRVFSLGQTFIKIEDNREMVSKICPNEKLTFPCTYFPSTAKPLGKIRLHGAFTLSLMHSLKKFFEQNITFKIIAFKKMSNLFHTH